MVTIENLTFSYHKSAPIFENFSWSLAPGERWSVIGPSGCGKTTLLYLLAGLRHPVSGTITYTNGHDGNRLSTGLILQDYGLLPWATAFENASMGLKIRRFDKETIKNETLKWMTELGVDTVAGHYPAELSGGQQQRVAIARTLALEPKLMLMDEPFASLDALTREDSLELILDLWKRLSSTMVLVTHNIGEAVFWGNKILVLKHPPNTTPDIVQNPGSGIKAYRNTPEFIALCKNLRELVEKNGRNGNTLMNKGRL